MYEVWVKHTLGACSDVPYLHGSWTGDSNWVIVTSGGSTTQVYIHCTFISSGRSPPKYRFLASVFEIDETLSSRCWPPLIDAQCLNLDTNRTAM